MYPLNNWFFLKVAAEEVGERSEQKLLHFFTIILLKILLKMLKYMHMLKRF
jgi:hypothetical protein